MKQLLDDKLTLSDLNTIECTSSNIEIMLNELLECRSLLVSAEVIEISILQTNFANTGYLNTELFRRLVNTWLEICH